MDRIRNSNANGCHSSCCADWCSGGLGTFITFTWTATETFFLNKRLPSELLRCQPNLTRTICLFHFKFINTVEFTSWISLTSINTSSHSDSVIVNTKIPFKVRCLILILFLRVFQGDYFYLTLANFVFAIFTANDTVCSTRAIWKLCHCFC